MNRYYKLYVVCSTVILVLKLVQTMHSTRLRNETQSAHNVNHAYTYLLCCDEPVVAASILISMTRLFFATTSPVLGTKGRLIQKKLQPTNARKIRIVVQ